MMITVIETRAAEVKLDDIIWAPDDGDWLIVKRVVSSAYEGNVIFYRRDYSEAAFGQDKIVLKRIVS